MLLLVIKPLKKSQYDDSQETAGCLQKNLFCEESSQWSEVCAGIEHFLS